MFDVKKRYRDGHGDHLAWVQSHVSLAAGIVT
jgi:hypothetical protein